MRRTNAPGAYGVVAQTEQIGLGDWVIVLLLAFGSWGLLSLWAYPGLHPSVWDEAAAAVGVRPAATLLPGYWRWIGSLVYGLVGFSRGNAALGVLAHVLMALNVVMVYACLREMLGFVMRARPQFSRRRTIVMRLASAVGALSFLFADPVWAAGQYFSETTVIVFLTVGALEAFFLFLRKQTLNYAYLCALLLGLLTAESPAGFMLMLVFLLVNVIILKRLPVIESPFFKPAVIAVGKWYMTFLFLAGLLVGIALNCAGYCLHGGLAANGQAVGDMPLMYLLSYWGRLVRAADLLGWILMFGVCLFPLVVSLMRFPVAADEDVFLPYSNGVVFLVCGSLAFAQSAFVPSLWYWTYAPNISHYMLALGSLLTALTLSLAVTILGVDALCRNHVQLARQVFGDDTDGGQCDESPRSAKWWAVLRLIGLFGVPAVLVALMVPDRAQNGTRTMLRFIADAVRATVDEAGDAEYLFTDGHLDAGLELESFLRGGSLKCISMMGAPKAYNIYLRTRGMENAPENRFAFEHDGGMGLRTWIRDRPADLAQSAVQMGFDLWKRDGKAVPPIGGLLSRPVGWKEADRLKGIEVARVLIRRVFDIHASGLYRESTDAVVKRVFNIIQWRLARQCQYRGDQLDLNGDAGAAIIEARMAKDLDGKNAIYHSIMAATRRREEAMNRTLTLREGLQLALSRADFHLGKFYAETVLAHEPADTDANFAMGMYYQRQNQYNRSEEYLKRCILSTPNQPAFYNNLAMVQSELGKFDAAERNAKKALEMLPDSDEVKDTVRYVRHKREQAAREKAERAKKAAAEEAKRAAKGAR